MLRIRTMWISASKMCHICLCIPLIRPSITTISSRQYEDNFCPKGEILSFWQIPATPGTSSGQIIEKGHNIHFLENSPSRDIAGRETLPDRFNQYGTVLTSYCLGSSFAIPQSRKAVFLLPQKSPLLHFPELIPYPGSLFL